MKKFIAVLLATTLSWSVSGVAMAEPNDQAVKETDAAKTVKKLSSNEKMMPTPEIQLSRLTVGLKLTVEQQNKIRPILIDEFAKLKEFRQADNLNLNPKQIQEKVETLRSETADKVQAVLTPEQKENYDIVRNEIRTNKKMRIKENRKGRIDTQTDTPLQEPK
jgi:hypothetical protein